MPDEQKYTNLTERLPELQEVLATSIQSDFLEIKKIDKGCGKYQRLEERFPQLRDAVFVVFSKYIKKEEHERETFVFVDDRGRSVCHISGKELALYGMVAGCDDLEVSDGYSWHYHDGI